MRILFTVAGTLMFASVACAGPTNPQANTPAPVLFATNGNIFVRVNPGKDVQLTFVGRDRAPRMSPEGRLVAFIRKSPNQAYLPCGGGDDPNVKYLADQIWAVDVQTGKAKLLVKDRQPGKGDEVRELKRTIASIDDDSLCFSPDGVTLYFISSAWVTSGALHAVNLRTGNLRFIAAANSVEVVPAGEYAGDLIVQQHRYFLGCGSYDWYWLITPSGREVGAVGEDDEQVASFRKANSAKQVYK